METVPRLQRAVRPSASYARSLAVLARAKAAGLTTKSSLIVGMGETFEEMAATLVDLRVQQFQTQEALRTLRQSGAAQRLLHHLEAVRCAQHATGTCVIDHVVSTRFQRRLKDFFFQNSFFPIGFLSINRNSHYFKPL